MVSKITSKVKWFQPAVIPMFLVLLCFYVTGLAIGYFVPFLISGFMFPVREMLLYPPNILGIFVVYIMAFLISRFCPVGFKSGGVFGHSFWGFRSFIRWQNIKMVRPCKFFNLLFIRLYSNENSKVTWLMFSPKEPAKFRKEFLRLAPLKTRKIFLSFLK